MSGTITVQLHGTTFKAGVGTSFYIPPGERDRDKGWLQTFGTHRQRA